MTVAGRSFMVDKRWFPALFFLAALLIAVQVYIIIADPNIGDEDAAAYAIQARNLCSDKGFSSNVIWHHIKLYPAIEHPEDYWPPFQSILEAFLFIFSVDSPWATKLVNLFGFYILVALVFIIGTRLFSRDVGGLAALICLMSSELAHYALSGRNEIFFIILMLLCMGLFVRCTSPGRSWRFAVAFGAFSGLAFLQRHIALLLLPTLAIAFMGRRCLAREQFREGIGISLHFRIFGICVLGFSIITIPFFVRNVTTFDRVLPPIAGELSHLYTTAYVENPDLRHIDADLSHYAFFKKAHYQKERNLVTVRYWTKKGLSELHILMLMFKRSHIFPTILIGCAVMAIFISGRQAGAAWLFFMSFLFLNIIAIPIYAHVEQRYFVFIIPFCSIFAAAFFCQMGVWIKDFGVLGSPVSRTRFFRFLLSLFLIVSLMLPCVRYYFKRIKEVGKSNVATEVGCWLHENIPTNSVVMCPMPYRFAYHSHRPTVLTPEDTAAVTQEIVDHYDVSHLVLLNGNVAPEQKQQKKRLVGRRLVLIKSFPAASVFRLDSL